MQFRKRDKCTVQTWSRRLAGYAINISPSSSLRAGGEQHLVWKWNRMRAKWLAIRGKSWKWSLPDASFLYIFLPNNISEKYTYISTWLFLLETRPPRLNFWSNAFPTGDGYRSFEFRIFLPRTRNSPLSKLVSSLFLREDREPTYSLRVSPLFSKLLQILVSPQAFNLLGRNCPSIQNFFSTFTFSDYSLWIIFPLDPLRSILRW